MDVGVLAAGAVPVDLSNQAVAEAAGTTLQAVMDSGDENTAMTLMATGAALLAARLTPRPQAVAVVGPMIRCSPSGSRASRF